MTVPTMPVSAAGVEHLRVGGGYGVPAEGTSPAGGLSVDDEGHLATDGDILANAFAGDGSALTSIPAPSDADIETAYNTQVAAASQAESEAGTEAAIRRFSPLRVAQAIAALGSGDVVGPASCVDATIPLFDGTTGKLLKISPVSITVDGNISLPDFKTIDGRDLNVDGAKLDGIEANSTSDMTGAEIVAAYEATVPLASQAEMETGTSATVKRVSPLLIKYAIAALALVNMTLLAMLTKLLSPTGLSSSSNSVVWDSDLAYTYNFTINETTTVAKSTGTEYDGQTVKFIITQGGTGGTVAWATDADGGFLGGSDFSDAIPAAGTTTGDVDIYSFMWLEGLTKWVLTAHLLH